MSEFNKFNELRAKHPRFIYHSFELNENELVFHFQIDKFHFRPTWRFNLNLGEYKFDRVQAERYGGVGVVLEMCLLSDRRGAMRWSFRVAEALVEKAVLQRIGRVFLPKRHYNRL